MIKKLRKGDKKNFETLKEAGRNGDLCLISSRRKREGKQVALVCAMRYKDGYYYPTPLAVMIEGNPFEDFEDPTGGEDARTGEDGGTGGEDGGEKESEEGST